MKKRPNNRVQNNISKPVHYWLLKNEEADYSIADFQRDNTAEWNGVRNFQARNYIRTMHMGELFLYYHANGNPSGAAGVGKIISEPHADPTQFDTKSIYFEKRATKESPVWSTVRVQFVAQFARVVSLSEIATSARLKGILVARRGQRLSVMPISQTHFAHIRTLGMRSA
ncbi:MAG: EVE domain-containing protein [Patescibacteria group bacterium]